ncbi:AcrR family transcriptional regulator [Streptosporangium becharense]|uniref:AcrR family transcriptional regulator n=1 Tax=Streptosporangium becharense TaxID=1816182 RepID=A0A7W9IMP8_9ACTN|nr:TetR/AcrR family transcriptional regulator [Streptosporangium becharense]MBB2910210.1 AcrR family transcriptional regulator [Streptosporangium becharense]MBB5822953.1 AcrR family transcriptional regulator [Streptosporangium becharense]
MTSGDGDRRETILRVATRLFAALGYDATTTSQIVEATGLSADALREEFGSRRELYLAVMERAYLAERASLEAALRGGSAATPEQTALMVHRIVDHYIDFCLAWPEVPALWLHRWLSDASDLTSVERDYVRPLLEMGGDAVGPAVSAGHIAPDADLDLLFAAMIWCVHGFMLGGVLGADDRRHGADDPEMLRRFRGWLHRTLHRAAGLPGPPPS